MSSGALHIARRLAGRLAAVCGDQALNSNLRLQAGNASLHDDLEPLMQAAVRFIIEAEQHAKGRKAEADALARGVKAANAAAQAARAALQEALEESGAPNVTTKHHLAQVKPGKGKVVVLDLNALPERFVKVERSAKLADIGKAMDAGEEVPGAVRSNGEPVLEIRVRTSEVPA